MFISKCSQSERIQISDYSGESYIRAYTCMGRIHRHCRLLQLESIHGQFG